MLYINNYYLFIYTFSFKINYYIIQGGNNKMKFENQIANDCGYVFLEIIISRLTDVRFVGYIFIMIIRNAS